MIPKGARLRGFGAYVAADYDELIDHPVEMGAYAFTGFRARGVAHEFALTGRHRADMSRLARDLKRLCEQYLPGRYHIEVIDLMANPRFAKDDQIVAIPTLVRKLPDPLRKIVGDLSDEARTLVGLQLRPHKQEETQ